jgi:hypothetical protein
MEPTCIYSQHCQCYKQKGAPCCWCTWKLGDWAVPMSDPATTIMCIPCYEARHGECIGDLRPISCVRCECACKRSQQWREKRNA